MDMLSAAIAWASEAHEGQKDKCSEPYILHPLRVMMAMQSEKDRAVAVLHDIIEDTSVRVSDLRDVFSREIVDAVVAITHDKNERVP